MKMSPVIKQIFYSLACFFNLMSLGMTYGYTAILTPSITNPESNLYTDEQTASWIVSLPGLSGLIALIIISPTMRIYGRRTAHISITIITLLGWITTSFAQSIPALVLGRLLHGLLFGSLYFYSICIGELTNPYLRGRMLNLKMLAVSLGISFVHLGGYYLDWRQLALTVTIPTTISLIIGLFWPETPDWLVSRGRFKEGEVEFYNLRGTDEGSAKEIKKLISEEVAKQNRYNQATENRLRKYGSKALWRPVMLLTCAVFIPEVGGRHYIPSYSLELLAQFSSNNTKGFFSTFVFDTVGIVAALVSAFIVNKFTRRKLLLVCGYLAVFLLFLSSVFMFVKVNYYDVTILSWISFISLGFYIFLVNVSTFPVSFMIMGELLPLEFREIGSLVDGIMSCAALMLFAKLVPIMKVSLGVHGLFIVCAILMAIALTYVNYELPETQGRTLHDIGNYFRGKSPKINFVRDVSDDESDELNFLNIELVKCGTISKK